MKNRRIVLVEIYSGQAGLCSRVDITGEGFSYVNLNSQLDLVTYFIEIAQLITNDIDINQHNCRFRFSFNNKTDKYNFIKFIDDLNLPNVETTSVSNFLSMHDFISNSNKPRADYCFLKAKDSN